jgi:protein dithiol oxidoreductase (disulfide-forming)
MNERHTSPDPARRRFQGFAAASLLLACLPVRAAIPAVQAGIDYLPVDPPQPTDGAGKIEVLEFFSYGCPHCADLNPLLKAWAKQLPADVVVRRVPVSFGRAAWANLAKLYYALEITGDLARLDDPVFAALHKERANLFTGKNIADWVAARGVDRKRFADALVSFGVAGQLARSDDLVKRYHIDAVPRLTVDGRFNVVAQRAQGFEDMLALSGRIVDLARTTRRG